VGSDVVQKFKEPQSDNQGNAITKPRDILDNKTKQVVKTIHEIQLESLDGLIIDAFIKSHEQYGDSMELVIMDNGEEFQFSINMDSSYGRSFLFRMPNIDVGSHILLKPYNFEDKETEKKRIGITVYQKDSDFDGGKVPPFWTKDKPGKLPQMEQVKKGSKMVWNSDKRDNFLYGAFEHWCKQFEIAPTAAPNVVDNAEEQVADQMDDATTFAEDQQRKSAEKKGDDGAIHPKSDSEEIDGLPF
jgi:hypothetical protein